jgi:hypothetical protein
VTAFHLPCAFDERECNDEAIGRVHDIADKGHASAYVCPDHIQWGHGWVREWTDGESVFTAFANKKEGAVR